MRFSFCGVTSKRPRWSAFARNGLERTTVRRSPMPQDGLLRTPPLQLDVDAVDVHVRRCILRIVRPSFLRVPRDAHPNVALRLTIGTEENLENPSLHGKGRFELEARLDRTGHRDANGRHDDKPHHA